MFFYVNADNTNVRFKLALGDQPSNGQGWTITNSTLTNRSNFFYFRISL
jgi:hypothetical protein